jgi:ribonuclease D
MAPELLVKKRDYEALLRSGFGSQSYRLPLSLSDWREDVIGNDLLGMLNRQA